MGDIFGKVISEVAEQMNYRTYRQQVISSNVANMDTPGYKAKETLFESELDSRLKLATTSQQHLKKSPSEDLYQIVDDPFSRIGNDSNTVDIDREMVKLNQNQILYTASADIIASKLDSLKNTIGGIS
jgi:flagellar basal-body rod protein FlgB